jgi:hypothetical protein
LRSWGVISDASGYNVPHLHIGCWVVAVAYIASENPGAADKDSPGAMRIGAAVGGDATCAGWPELTVAPIPGTVAIMPAYYTHWTVPLRGPGRRISVAFNVHEMRNERDKERVQTRKSG